MKMKKILLKSSILAIICVLLSQLSVFADDIIESHITYGDVNLDGTINIKDRVILARYLDGWEEELYQLNAEQLANADVCADGEVNQLDYKILKEYTIGYAISFPFIYGDANCDNKVDVTDVTAIQKHLSEDYDYELSREGINRADVNLDGVIDVADVLVLQRHIAEMQEYLKLPVDITLSDIMENTIEYESLENYDKKIICGFDIGDLTISNIKQQLKSNLKVDVYNTKGEKLDDNSLLATGYTIKIDERTEEEVPAEYLTGNIGEYTVILYGDTTGDGKINAIDALALIKDINNIIPFTSEVYREAGRIISANGQGPTAIDALAIIKAANGKFEINQNK